MPNWAYTNYAVEGDKKEITELNRLFNRTMSMKRPAAKNGFGPGWIGNLVKTFGHNWKEYPCRGTFSIPHLDEKGVLRFDTETAWGRCDCIELLIKERFPNVNVYFIEEECGMGIFVTNDEKGLYFPDQYIVETTDDDTNYCTEKEAIDLLSKTAGKPFNNISEALEWVKQWNDSRCDDDLTGFITVKKAQLEE